MKNDESYILKLKLSVSEIVWYCSICDSRNLELLKQDN